MSITYRPPFDEDDARDLRALYRKPGPGSSPELDAAVRRSWHPGHSWHPGWAAAACATLVAGLFTWTNMREAVPQNETDTQAVTQAAGGHTGSSAMTLAVTPATAPATAPAMAPAITPAITQAMTPPMAQPDQAVEAVPAMATQASDPPAVEVVAFSEQDIEARVAHIRQLMQNDQQDAAVLALRELQQGAPDLALPDDLQELAQQNPA